MFLVTIEVQRWHGGHYMVSGGNDGLDNLNVLSVYMFFSQCFGEMSDNNKDDLHYIFQVQNELGPVKYNNIFFLIIIYFTTFFVFRNLHVNLRTTLYSWCTVIPIWSHILNIVKKLRDMLGL